MGKRYTRIYMDGYDQAIGDIEFDAKYLDETEIEAENDRLKIELNNAEMEIEELKVNAGNARIQIGNLEAEIAELKEKLDNLRPYSQEVVSAISKERDTLKCLLRAAWKAVVRSEPYPYNFVGRIIKEIGEAE